MVFTHTHSKELSVDTFGCASKSVIVLINPSKFTIRPSRMFYHQKQMLRCGGGEGSGDVEDKQ